MSSDSDATCPSDAFFGNPVQPIIGDRTFHDIARYVSGGCTAVSIILCFGLCFMHLCTYRDRHEQRQIARIVLTPAIISTFDLLSLVFYSDSGFLKPIGEYYDAVALVSLYLLFVTYATQPEGRGNPRRLFESIPNLYAQHSYQQLSNNELGQYYRTWFFVFQIIPVRAITMIASIGVDGTVCKQLKDHNRAATVVSVITTLSTILCFLAVIRMMKFIKPSLHEKKPVMKTVALKGLVAFAVLLELVFSILKTTDALHTSSTTNKKDLFIGLPDMIICCVGLIFSILIVIPYRTTPYTAKAMPGVQKYSFFRGLIDVLNFTDVLILGLSCLPSAFSNWRRRLEEGTHATYQQNDMYGSESDTVPVMSPSTYHGQNGKRNEEYEMSRQ